MVIPLPHKQLGRPGLEKSLEKPVAEQVAPTGSGPAPPAACTGRPQVGCCRCVCSCVYRNCLPYAAAVLQGVAKKPTPRTDAPFWVPPKTTNFLGSAKNNFPFFPMLFFSWLA